jgi:hypothetical protein
MTTPPLSPAAQAVLDAYEDAPIIGGPHGGDALGIAAAIRALVEQVARIGPTGMPHIIHADIIAIAAELDGKEVEP